MDTQTLKKRIGKNLQTKRKELGYSSAKAFAIHKKISPDTYTGYEQGRIALPLEKAWEFADEFHCTLDELVGRPFPAPSYTDSRQEMLNGCYESLNEDSKTEIVGMIESIAADPKRRIVKDGQEYIEAEHEVGAA